MRKAGRVSLVLLGLASLVIVGSLAYIAGRAVKATDDLADAAVVITGEGEFTNYGPLTVQTIKNLAELTTVEFVEYTTIEKGDDRGWLNWARGDRISMFAVARIGAGVDLDALSSDDVFVDREEGRAVIRVPSADITYIAVDSEATHVYDRDTGVFTKGDPQLERAARLAAEEVLVDLALETGILDRAEDRAVEVLTDLIESLGYTDVSILVKPSPAPSP